LLQYEREEMIFEEDYVDVGELSGTSRLLLAYLLPLVSSSHPFLLDISLHCLSLFPYRIVTYPTPLPFPPVEMDPSLDPDSPSSGPSLSRPHTPSSLNLSLSLSPSTSNTIANTQSNSKPEQPLALADKAERILGLIPGTLVHARAALENARDEIRRTADTTAPFGTYVSADSQTGLKGKMSRARKAMSVSLSHMPNVVVGLGGRDEMILRERRRRAVDGVLCWQKEVARLEAAEVSTSQKKR
jgi:hypothetical protein